MYRWINYNIIFISILAITFIQTEKPELRLQNTDPLKTDIFKTTDLFESTDVLSISIEGDIKKLMRDRGDDASRHPLSLTYKTKDSIEVSMPIEAKTRGNFRRKLGGCIYPPIMLYFTDSAAREKSLFAGQKKLKLVMPCRNDEYVVKEWLAYQIYNLITPQSFRARLVELKLKESRNKDEDQIFAVLLEDEDDMARRNNKKSIATMKLQPSQTDSQAFHRMALFEYLIGNTDWSVQYLQNIKLIVNDSSGSELPVAVPYDFDMSGWVDAPYAKPADALFLKSVKIRRYRGYCVNDISVYTPAINQFLSIRKDVYELVNGCKNLSPKTLKAQIEFLDSFYKILEDPQKLKKDLLYPCDKNGTGNVVIGGLQNKID